ncbi:PLP-dependent aminotransferase family protein [Spiroplasma cantharicola]|uniref:L-seryl-tRNA selenocysteine synthase n=1 Tax=Spiroplasma cantharicola TaxID=362837 RepID=A0A0M5KJ86_9MOLU|nr:PLP-dependent transferase [Spiroplasma cantharicola]ALD66506.1 L-seryl-tRNA selenocysteine synthase [Spiroplasma cantharicola]
MTKKFKKVINADGRMTILGVSKFNSNVAQAMEYAGNNFFIMSEFKEIVYDKIKKIIKSENVCVVNSASAGITLSACASIYKDKIYDVNKIIPDKKEIILAKGHNIDFGAPIESLLNLVNAKIMEAGYSNKCSIEDYKYYFNKNTAALLYVVSHHCVQKNMASLDEVIKLCKENNIVLIVDCAAEEDIWKYSNKDIDVVIFSGSKAIEGPTSGFVFGKNKIIIENIKKHQDIIGRTMKIGKENIFGLLSALENYKINKNNNFDEYLKIFSLNKNILCKKDIDTRGIERIRFEIVNKKNSAKELANYLKECDIAIYLRDYFAFQGYLDIDIRNINIEEAKIINKYITLFFEGR